MLNVRITTIWNNLQKNNHPTTRLLIKKNVKSKYALFFRLTVLELRRDSGRWWSWSAAGCRQCPYVTPSRRHRRRRDRDRSTAEPFRTLDAAFRAPWVRPTAARQPGGRNWSWQCCPWRPVSCRLPRRTAHVKKKHEQNARFVNEPRTHAHCPQKSRRVGHN